MVCRLHTPPNECSHSAVHGAAAMQDSNAYSAIAVFLLMESIFWEMNMNCGSVHKYNKHPYVRDFVSDPVKQQIVKDAGVYICVGFDSHRLEDYAGNYVHDMYDFLRRNGFQTADRLIFSSAPSVCRRIHCRKAFLRIPHVQKGELLR